MTSATRDKKNGCAKSRKLSATTTDSNEMSSWSSRWNASDGAESLRQFVYDSLR